MKKIQQAMFDAYSIDIIELSNYEVTAAGRIIIRNSGGTSASEGGMGSGSKSSEEKGTVSSPDQKINKSADRDDDKFDPIGKEVKKQEEKNKSEND